MHSCVLMSGMARVCARHAAAAAEEWHASSCVWGGAKVMCVRFCGMTRIGMTGAGGALQVCICE